MRMASKADIATLLRECKSLPQAKRLHALVEEQASPNTFISNLVIQMYGNCGSVSDALTVFEKLGVHHCNVFSWTIMFTVYAQNGHLLRARSLFDIMPQRNVVSWNSMLACYARCGDLNEARELFNRIPERSLATWNAMISAYAQNELPSEAVKLFRDMDLEGVRPDKVTFVSTLNAGASLQSDTAIALVKVKESGLESDVSVGTSLITLYSRCGSVENAKRSFDLITVPNVVSWTALLAAYAQNGHLLQATSLFAQMPERNEVSWTAMISAHAQCGCPNEALHLFKTMDLEGFRPDKVTFVSVIDAASSLCDVHTGTVIHKEMTDSGVEQDMAVGNSLVSMYGRFDMLEQAKSIFDCVETRNVVTWTAILGAHVQSGDLHSARELFNRMPVRNVVSWNAMITGYVDDSDAVSAVDLYRKMRLEGVPADRVTFAGVLDACACLTSVELGSWIHRQVEETGFQSDLCVSTALLNMYSKCGCLEQVQEVFTSAPVQDLVLWSSLVAAYAHNGHGFRALEMFHCMQLHGVPPNGVTFISVIFACSHVGMIEDGLRRIESMGPDFGLDPEFDHYVCVVDLLGRSGRMSDAEALVRASQLPLIAWKSLLGSCYGDLDVNRARRISEIVLQDDSLDGATHVLLSNIYRRERESKRNL